MNTAFLFFKSPIIVDNRRSREQIRGCSLFTTDSQKTPTTTKCLVFDQGGLRYRRHQKTTILVKLILHFCYSFSALCMNGFSALNKVPFVLGELLKPVSAVSSTFSNPICLSNARKAFPGMAPPFHWDQLITLSFRSCCT